MSVMEFESLALGKEPHKPNKKTIKLGPLLDVPTYPTRFNFDTGRVPFPLEPWGNNAWGNCVSVDAYNQLVRLERIEKRGTIKIDENDVVDFYQDESERQFGNRPQSAGDQYDQGLVMQYMFRDWRKFGLTTKLQKNPWKIAAFGELETNNPSELRAAIFALHGVSFGISLPLSAYDQMRQGQPWDVSTGPRAQPGSWGGHAIYCPQYDEYGYTPLTWGRRQKMTNAFVQTYADEAWGVVDSVDVGGTGKWLNVDAMMQKLRDIGASGIE